MKSKFFAFFLGLFTVASFCAYAELPTIGGRYAIRGTGGEAGELTIRTDCSSSEYREWSAPKNSALAQALRTQKFECKSGKLEFRGETLKMDDLGNLAGKDFYAIRNTGREPFEIHERTVPNGNLTETHSPDRDCDAIVINRGTLSKPVYYTTSDLICGYLDGGGTQPVAIYYDAPMKRVCFATSFGTSCE